MVSPAMAAVAWGAQPGARSPLRKGRMVRPPPAGGRSRACASAAAGESMRRVWAIHCTREPPSVSAPPSRRRRRSMR